MIESWKVTAIVALTLAGLWVLTLGLSAMDPPRAAFLGAFTAAIVTAAAVLGNSFFRDRLAARTEQRALQRVHVEKALFLWSFVSRASLHVGGMVAIWKSASFKQIGTSPSPSDLSNDDAARFRTMLGARPLKIDPALEAAALLPPDIAVKVIDPLTMLETNMTTTFAFALIPDQYFVARQNVDRAVEKGEKVVQALQAAAAHLSAYLKRLGYVE